MNLVPHISKILLFVMFFTVSCNQLKDFEKIDTKYKSDRIELINKINPNKNYAYWEYVFAQPGHMYEPAKILFNHGDSTLKSNYSTKTPESGFFIECRPLYCYSYIMYIEDNKVYYVINEKQLEKFLNRIDNLEEALIISKIKGLWFDSEHEEAGSYRKTSNGYELNLGKFNMCPVSREAINVNIDTLGNFKSKSLGVYFKSDDCYSI